MNRITLCLTCVLIAAPVAAARPITTNRESSAFAYAADKLFRTELYFGFGKNDGSEVSDAEWEAFLATEVTPRFPEGFTVLYANGQFRTASGKIVRERSRVIVLLYPKKARSVSSSKIDAVRQAYARLFDQESVLRVDFRQSVRVFF